MQRMQHPASINRVLTTLALGLSLSACSVTPKTTPPLDYRWTPLATTEHAAQIDQILKAEFALQRQGSEQATSIYLDAANRSQDAEVAKRATSIAIMGEDDESVLEASSRWIELNPSASEAYPINLQALLNLGQSDQAEALLLQAKQHNVSLDFLPNFVDQNVRQNVITADLNALFSSPTLAADIYVKIASFHVRFLNGEYSFIVDHISPLLNDSPQQEHEGLIIIKAFSEEQTGLPDSAEATLINGLKQFPDSHRMMANYLEILIKNSQYQKALTTFKNAALPEYLQQQIGISMAQLLLQKGQPQLSSTLISLLPKHGALRDDLLFTLANAQYQLGHYNEALKSLLNVFGKLSWKASDALVHWLYAAHQEDQINTLILKRAAVDLEAGHIIGVADLHLDQQRPDLAIDLLTRSLPVFPNTDGIRYKRAITYDTQNEWQLALQDLTILHQKHPNDPAYINALGYTMLVRTPDNFDKAFQLIKQAYALDKDSPAIMDSLGWGYYLQGDFKQAEALLSQAWDNMQDAEIGAHYGELLWQLGDTDGALEIWQKSLEDNQELPTLINTLEQYAPKLLGT